MHDHNREAGRAGALRDVSGLRSGKRRGTSIPEHPDIPRTDDEGRLDGDSAERYGEPIRDAAGGMSELPPDAHVRVGVRELPAAAALGVELSVDLLPTEQALLADLFAVIAEHSDDAILPVEVERVGQAFAFACERHADQRRK